MIAITPKNQGAKMRQTSLKTKLKMQKRTTIKNRWNQNGQINTYRFTKELDRQ